MEGNHKIKDEDGLSTFSKVYFVQKNLKNVQFLLLWCFAFVQKDNEKKSSLCKLYELHKFCYASLICMKN